MEGADCEAAAGGPRNCAPPPPAEGAYVPCGICAYCNFLNPSDFLNVFPAGGPVGGPAGEGEANVGGGMGGATLVCILGVD